MVLVCHPHKFIYIKTHKTASTTVEMYLEPYCAPDDHVVTQVRDGEIICDKGIVGSRVQDHARTRDPDNVYWFNHMAASRVKRQLGAEMFDAYTKVACLRNPFKRFVSEYLFTSVWAQGIEPPPDLASAKREFREYLFRSPEDKWTPLRPKPDYWLVHINREFVIDHILRTEHLKEDLRVFLAAVGIEVDEITLTRERDNSSVKRDWSHMDFYDAPDLVERVIELEDWVFDLGGYSRDPADA